MYQFPCPETVLQIKTFRLYMEGNEMFQDGDENFGLQNFLSIKIVKASYTRTGKFIELYRTTRI